MNEPVLFRSATPSDVRTDRREIDVLAVPYDTPTVVRDPGSVSPYEETIVRGAFANVADRAHRVKVLRDHDPKRAVGRCATIDADQADGLKATLKIANTILGDETLALAVDGVLDVSIGFSPRESTWNTGRSTVRRVSCWLHELSLLPLAAYESATVLAVREQPAPPEPVTSATPRLDELRDWYLTMRYGSD